MDFNQDFLSRQADPNELGAIVQRQGSRLQQIGQSFVRVQSLDEIASAIGELDFRAVESSGKLRMIMSAINLLDEFGINAHLAGFDVNGVPQFYLSADDGSIVAAGGLLKIDHNGITDSSSLLGLTSKDAGNQNIMGRVWYSFNSGDQPVVQGLHVFHFVSDTARFSDNFEDGTLSAWVTSGSPSIETDGVQEGSYYARLSSANTISKTLSASAYGANTWYFVTCIYRSTTAGGSLQLEYGGAAPVIHGLSTMQADTWYRAFIVFQANADTTPTLTFSKNSGTGTLDIDDVYVNEMNILPLGIGGASGFGTITSNIELYGNINLKSGKYLTLDGVDVFASGSAVLGADYSITSAAATYEDTGLSITLPAKGTYLVRADVRGKIKGNAGTFWWLTAKFYNSTDAADVANSERLIVLTNQTAVELHNTAPITAIVTVTASKTIKLYAYRHGAGTPSWTTSQIGSDTNGRTVMSYECLKV